MKNLVVSVACLFGILFFAVSICFAEPGASERLVKFNDDVKSLSEPSENSEIGAIHNVVPGPVLDEDGDRYCVAYNNNVTISVPDEGLTFYLIYYHRVKNADGSWSEWSEDFIGAVWYFTPQLAKDMYLELYMYLREEDGSIPSSKWQFMIEMHDPNNGDLLNTFVVNRYKYWYPLLESVGYDSPNSNQKAQE